MRFKGERVKTRKEYSGPKVRYADFVCYASLEWQNYYDARSLNELDVDNLKAMRHFWKQIPMDTIRGYKLQLAHENPALYSALFQSKKHANPHHFKAWHHRIREKVKAYFQRWRGPRYEDPYR